MGSIKVFGGKRHVSANHVRAITNHDEVFNHLLKALWVSLSIRNPGGPIGQGVNLLSLISFHLWAELVMNFRALFIMITMRERALRSILLHGRAFRRFSAKSWRLFRRKIQRMECTCQRYQDRFKVEMDKASCMSRANLFCAKSSDQCSSTFRDAIEDLMQNGHLFSTIDDLVRPLLPPLVLVSPLIHTCYLAH